MRTKSELRTYWKKVRLSIPSSRRKEASQSLLSLPLLKGIVASFVSFRDEIDTSHLNRFLAQKNRLALPRIEKDGIVFYHVKRLDNELAPSPLGILEPIPSLCKKVEKIDVILVPGLAFDHKHHRLGYGKGYYDRFLAAHPMISIGIGFKEQLTDGLPCEPHDIELSQLQLY